MMIFSNIIGFLLSVALLGCVYGFYRTWKTGTYPEYREFLSGSVPVALPSEGLWNGSAAELGDISWKGKKVLVGARGINVFRKNGVTSEAYPFALLITDSIGFPGKKILRLDYDQKENPFWLRFIADEMVSVGQDKYLGIVYITLIPGTPFRMGYFRLEK